jgi:hypothetical protein
MVRGDLVGIQKSVILLGGAVNIHCVPSLPGLQCPPLLITSLSVAQGTHCES